MPNNVTPDKNDVGELKMQIQELKMFVAQMAHEKDISERTMWKKLEELTKMV